MLVIPAWSVFAMFKYKPLLFELRFPGNPYKIQKFLIVNLQKLSTADWKSGNIDPTILLPFYSK